MSDSSGYWRRRLAPIFITTTTLAFRTMQLLMSRKVIRADTYANATRCAIDMQRLHAEAGGNISTDVSFINCYFVYCMRFQCHLWLLVSDDTQDSDFHSSSFLCLRITVL